MGKKSEKKIKSEKINALRKQYDLFIEEDKVRKERNDYILQRLDKIRHITSTALQIRPKTVFSGFSRFDYRQDNVIPYNDAHVTRMSRELVQQNLQLEVQRNYEELSLLREISKKYILIPKVLSNVNTCLPPNLLPETDKIEPELKSKETDNSDWRSKYDILEQLKKKENEENINKPYKEEHHVTQPPSKTPYQPQTIFNNNVQKVEYDHVPAKYEAEIPEKDLPDNNSKIENDITISNLKINDIEQEEHVTNFAHPSNVVDTNLISPTVAAEPSVPGPNLYTDPGFEQIPYVGTDVVDNNQPIAETASYVAPQEQINECYAENITQEQPIDNNISYGHVPEYQDYPNEYKHDVPVTETIQNSENEVNIQDDYSPISVVNPSEIPQVLNLEPEVDNSVGIINKVEENVEYPNDVTYVQDYTPSDNNIVPQDDVNINPAYVAANAVTTEHYNNNDGYVSSKQEDIVEQNVAVDAENTSQVVGIEAFEEEQKELAYAYDQEPPGDAYDPEYQPSQAYQPEVDYNYPNETADQNAYPVEINEHEETTLRYDPNFEQQYATNYEQGYVQQETYEQSQPTDQYPQSAEYGEDYEQYNYEQQNQNIVQQVEQALDNEEGYVQTSVPEEIATVAE